MSLEHAVNTSSLRIVHGELDHTLQRAAGEFEAWLADPAMGKALDQCRRDLVQIGGTLRLIELAGAALLADEMAASLAALQDRGEHQPDASQLSALSHAFVVLPRYLDFVARHRQALPMLVLPWVNPLRGARRRPFLPEYHFEAWQPPPSPTALSWPRSSASAGQLRRLHSMYQTGLARLLRDQRTGSPASQAALELMARSALRWSMAFPATAGGAVLPLLAGATTALAEGLLQPDLNRLRVLARGEQLLRRLQREGGSALDAAEQIEPLRSALLFMLALTPVEALAELPPGRSRSLCQHLWSALALRPLTPDARELDRLARAMQGPADALDSVIAALREELVTLRGTLEIGAQNQGLMDEDLAVLQQGLNRFVDTLQMIGLQAPAQALRSEQAAVASWRGRSGHLALESFQPLAEAMLYAESCLSALTRGVATVEELQQLDEGRRDALLAESHLAEARAIVLREAQANVQLAKRAVTAYVDAGLDRTHIANVVATLNGVRGGLASLGHHEVAEVVQGCVEVIAHHQKERVAAGEATHQQLEILADALVGLDHCLEELAATGEVDDVALRLAEDSLAALGLARRAAS